MMKSQKANTGIGLGLGVGIVILLLSGIFAFVAYKLWVMTPSTQLGLYQTAFLWGVSVVGCLYLLLSAACIFYSIREKQLEEGR